MMDILWYKNTLYKHLESLWGQGEGFYGKFLNINTNWDFKVWLNGIFAACDLELNYSGPSDDNIIIGSKDDRFIQFLCIGAFTITAPTGCIALKFKNGSGTSVKQFSINDKGYFTITESTEWNSITLYFDDVALGMDINRGYQYKDAVESNRVTMSSAAIFTNKHSNDINLNSYVVQTFKNKWNSLVTPPNYGIGSKNIQGVLSKNPQIAPDNGNIETYKYSRKYNNKENPYFWDLQDCRCFICYSNFGGSDLWGEDGNIQTSGRSEQPYSIDNKVGRDEVYKTDSTDNWMNKEYYLGIISEDQDSKSSGTTVIDQGKTYYSWYTMKTYNNQKKNIQTFTPANRLTIKLNVLDGTQTITVSTGNNVTNTYNLELFDSVIVAKRDLISLQKAFDDNYMMKYVLFYACNRPNDPYEYVNIVPTKYVPQNFIGINHTENTGSWKGTTGVTTDDAGYLITDTGISGYFNFNTNTPVNSWFDLEFVEWQPEEAEPIVESLTVTLPDIQYYNITSLLKKQRELAFPRDIGYLTDDLIITPKFKNNIEYETSPQEYEWTFSMENITDRFYDNFHIHYPTDICYKLTVDNVVLINETTPGLCTSLHKWNAKAFNFEGYQLKTNIHPSSLATAMLIQDYIKVQGMPNWFEDFFVDIGSAMMGVSGVDYSYRRGFEIMATGYETTTHTNDDTWNSVFYCEGGVFGWSEWIDTYTNMIPASTSISNSGSSNWKLNLTYYASQISYLWHGSRDKWPSDWTARGIQAGFTKGILINYPNIDQVDAQSFKIPKNTMPSMAVIICDSYNLT